VEGLWRRRGRERDFRYVKGCGVVQADFGWRMELGNDSRSNHPGEVWGLRRNTFAILFSTFDPTFYRFPSTFISISFITLLSFPWAPSYFLLVPNLKSLSRVSFISSNPKIRVRRYALDVLVLSSLCLSFIIFNSVYCDS